MIYKVKCDGGVMYVDANLVQASAGLCVYFGDDPLHDEDPFAEGDKDREGFGWNPTPYQTADAHHNADKMADLIASYCNMGEVISIEEIEE
jgi:hypothetical protein